MKNKNGFTLVELLAVIAILAILVIMALPAVLRIYRKARMTSFENEVKSIYKQAQNQIIADSLNLNVGGEKVYASDINGNTSTEGTLELQGGDKIKYCVLVDNDGNIKKLYVSNGTYQFISEDPNVLNNIENIEIEDITGTDEITGKDNCLQSSSIASDPSLFTYTISNNEVTITGYNGLLHAYEIYNTSSCVSEVAVLLKDLYDLDDETAAYGANELCNGREVEGKTMSTFFEEYNVLPGNYEEYGVRIYKVDDITQEIDKPQCISGGTQLLIMAYGMDETSASYAANELCNGREVDGLSLQKAIETEIVTSEYYEMLGLHNIFLSRNGNISIPSTIEGYPVTSIGDSAFYRYPITEVTLPSTLKTIEDNAFKRTNLTSIRIPNGVTTIGSYAFGESSLTSITIPNSVTEIGDYAFMFNKLTSITIPNSVTSIGYGAFVHNELTSITIPRNVETIDYWAFSENKLENVIIKGKSSSSDFTDYYPGWGWATDVTCVKNNTSNVENGCITWTGSE